jgi:hypothetical protein
LQIVKNPEGSGLYFPDYGVVAGNAYEAQHRRQEGVGSACQVGSLLDVLEKKNPRSHHGPFARQLFYANPYESTGQSPN